MGAESVDLPVIHDNDPVAPLYTGDSLRDDQTRGVRNLLGKGTPDFGVCRRVYGAGAVIQYQDPGLPQKGSGDAQTLFLAAGDIGSALLDVCIVTFGHFPDKFIRAGQLACMPALLLCGVGIAPAQIVVNGAGEEHVLLKNNSDLSAQNVQIVFSDIMPSDKDPPLRDVIKAADQIDQAGLGGASSPDHSDAFARPDLQINVFENGLRRSRAVGKVYIFEADAAVRDLHERILRVREAGLFCDDLCDTPGTGLGHRDHDHDHGKHHQAHQDIHAVGQQTHQVSGGQLAADDHVGAEPADQQDAGIDDSHHDRADRRESELRLKKHLIDIRGGPVEASDLIILADISLDDTDRGNIFLYAFVHGVIPLKHLLEIAGGRPHHSAHKHSQHGYGNQVNAREPGADGEGHEQGDGHCRRRSHGHPEHHHIGILNIGDIRREPCDQTGC